MRFSFSRFFHGGDWNRSAFSWVIKLSPYPLPSPHFPFLASLHSLWHPNIPFPLHPSQWISLLLFKDLFFFFFSYLLMPVFQFFFLLFILINSKKKKIKKIQNLSLLILGDLLLLDLFANQVPTCHMNSLIDARLFFTCVYLNRKQLAGWLALFPF